MADVTPDLIIGVDFGMTHTGVAYCTEPWTTVNRFQQWSGIDSKVANKVPSRIAYSTRTKSFKGWGFNVDFDDPESDIQEFFKLYLDPEYRDGYDQITNADAQRYYRDYLSLIHGHILGFFNARFPNLSAMAVEFIFSVPTTWTSPKLINELEDTIRQAGFGEDGPRHTARISLTEAEAAAVNVVANYVKRDDVICICDAGGGTTDVNILKVRSSPGEPINLESLSKVEGAAVGSALIDIRVQQYLEQLLNRAAQLLPASPEELAERMMRGRFERFKCTFGTSAAANLPALILEVPGPPPNIDVAAAEIHNSRISIPQTLLQKLFDEQVNNMIQLVINQFVNLGTAAPEERVAYLVLSGGLGSSQYVRDRLKRYFQSGAAATLSNTEGMQMLLAEDPQLAVVLGLVAQRAQKLSHQSRDNIGWRARVSYGVVLNQRYDPARHHNQVIYTDPRDKQKWALNQIEWLIKEGDLVDDDGVSKHVRAKLHRAQLTRPWRAQIVISTERRDRLPPDLSGSNVKTLCTVEADLRYIDRITKNSHWWQLGKRYELAEFDLRVIAGRADLKFQLWNNGRLLTGENEGVVIDWSSRAPTAAEDQYFEQS